MDASHVNGYALDLCHKGQYSTICSVLWHLKLIWSLKIEITKNKDDCSTEKFFFTHILSIKLKKINVLVGIKIDYTQFLVN